MHLSLLSFSFRYIITVALIGFPCIQGAPNEFPLYPADSLFEMTGVKILGQMDCKDRRFPKCIPNRIFLHGNKTCFNPSIIRTKNWESNIGKVRPYLVAVRTEGMNCASYNIPNTHINRDLHFEVLDEHFKVIQDVQIFIKHLGDSRSLRTTYNYSHSSHIFYMYPNGLVSRVAKREGNLTEIVIGQDARLLNLKERLWIHFVCYHKGCLSKVNGVHPFIRIPLELVVINKKLIAYANPATARIVVPYGRNQAFFSNNNLDTYMINYLGPALEIYKIDSGQRVKTINYYNISQDWHMQGGMMSPWRTRRNNGWLGIAHAYNYYNGRNNRSKYAKFGYNYVSAFFLISEREPFHISKLGELFCFGSNTDNTKCDNVQFISGVIVSKNRVVVSYGVNDCDSRLWSMAVDEVDDMLDSVDNMSSADQPSAALEINAGERIDKEISRIVRDWTEQRRLGATAQSIK